MSVFSRGPRDTILKPSAASHAVASRKLATARVVWIFRIIVCREGDRVWEKTGRK